MDELEMIRRKKMLELMKRAGMIGVKPKREVLIEAITTLDNRVEFIGVPNFAEFEKRVWSGLG